MCAPEVAVVRAEDRERRDIAWRDCTKNGTDLPVDRFDQLVVERAIAPPHRPIGADERHSLASWRVAAGTARLRSRPGSTEAASAASARSSGGGAATTPEMSCGFSQETIKRRAASFRARRASAGMRRRGWRGLDREPLSRGSGSRSRQASRQGATCRSRPSRSRRRQTRVRASEATDRGDPTSPLAVGPCAGAPSTVFPITPVR